MADDPELPEDDRFPELIDTRAGLIKIAEHLRQTLDPSLTRYFRSFYTLLANYLMRIRADRRFRSSQTACVLTAVTIICSIGLYRVDDMEQLERIGAYVTGVGQLLVLIWIITTFYNQKIDIHDQYEQLSQQRQLMQQQTALSVISFHREQLDGIARSLISHIAKADLLANLARDRIIAHNPDFYANFILSSDSLQEDLLAVLNANDRHMVALARRYLDRIKNLKDLLSSADPAGTLQSAILFDSPISGLGYILGLSDCVTSTNDEAFSN